MRRTTGVNPADTAKLCFAENVELFGNAQYQPEKFNLYNGLYNLAIAVEQLQIELQQARLEIARLKQQR